MGEDRRVRRVSTNERKRIKHKAKVYLISAIVILVAWSGVKVVQFNRQREERLQSIQQEKQLLEEAHTKTKTEKENLEKTLLEKEEEIKKLKQAKARIVPVAYAKPTGDCQTWMQQAGITDMANAYILIKRESGCNPFATNKSSGAYGIPQSLPGTKMASAGADWRTNPVTQLKWMQSYVQKRYGSWANAVAHSTRVGWY